MKSVTAAWILVMVCFSWDPNIEPGILNYTIYQEIGTDVRRVGPAIRHPGGEACVELIRAELGVAWYFVTAWDQDGFESSPSNKVECDQTCQEKYLRPQIMTGIQIEKH